MRANRKKDSIFAAHFQLNDSAKLVIKKIIFKMEQKKVNGG